MPPPPPNAPCPCCSGRKYKKCCGPAHDGIAAPSAEALMRSRYCAYAVGNASYILATTHPDSPHWNPDRERWIAEVRAFAAETTFLGLHVSAAQEDGDTATVTFDASMMQAGKSLSRKERSRFFRVVGRWLYHSADAGDPHPNGY